ncbi:MAG: hypothetical protein ACOCZS_04060 [Verrucomicrobiota bacterium]
MKKAKFFAYLNKYALAESITGETDSGALRRAVVIPARGENTELPATLQSLEKNPAEDCRATLVTVVVNGVSPYDVSTRSLHAETVADAREIQAANLRTLQWLAAKAGESPLHLTWIDHASRGREFSPRQGVALARKIGADSILSLLFSRLTGRAGKEQELENFPILHLDADTLVDRHYLRAVDAGLRNSGKEAAVIDFRHRLPDSSVAVRKAVTAYDVYLRYYARGLRFAGSPYAFHTIGSAMASTLGGYVKAGGIPAQREAGEDFYFLQQLRKITEIESICDTTVYPSGRIESRNIFGTGKGIQAMLAAEESGYPVYSPEIFCQLQTALRVITENITASPEDILTGIDESIIRNFLLEKGFLTVMKKWQHNYRRRADLRHAFQVWFDALATYRLIRRMSSDPAYPPRPLLEAWTELANYCRCKFCSTPNMRATGML